MISLTANQVLDQRLVGAKAASLSRIHSLGCRIPPGFIFEASYCESLIAHAGLQERLQWLQKHGPLLKEAYVLELGAEIVQQLRGTPLPPEFEQDLERCFDMLGGGDTALICRSSCLMEDAGNSAFPGIFLSEAGLASLAALQQAVMNCVCSLFRPKALRYCLRLQGSQPQFSMGLIIQRFVNTTCAGVMFYWNPETILIEGVRGSGKLLMSGQTRPVCYRKDTRGTWEMTGGEREMGDLLKTKQLQELMRIAELASEAWESPVDIEFGFHGKSDSSYIFQCRPVTRELPGDGTGESTDLSGINSSRGFGCAPGIARGKAVDPGRGGLVPEDSSKPIALVEILTERNYDLIFDVKGIVTEQVGSQLNHLSIACRELGIPYVSGFDDARIRFHGRQVVVDGTRGTVFLGSDDFSLCEKSATVAPSGDLETNFAYLPYFKEQRRYARESGRSVFTGGLYLILEALYQSRTDQELLQCMIRQLSETLGQEKGSGSMILWFPRLAPEEFSIFNQSLKGRPFSQETLERIFQKICEEGKRRFGVTLSLQ